MGKTQKRAAKKRAAAEAAGLLVDAKTPRREGGGLPTQSPHARELNEAFKAGNWEEALRALAALKSTGGALTVIMCNKVITACGKGGKWQEARGVLDNMRRSLPGKQLLESRGAARPPQAPASWVEPNVVTYAAVIRYMGDAGECTAALELFGTMKADGVAPDTIAYNSAINACKGDPSRLGDRALAVLQEAVDAGLADVITYNAALGVLERAGRWQDACSSLDAMASPGAPIPPNSISFCHVISACAVAGECDRAIALLDRMASLGVPLSIHCHNAALGACKRVGRWVDALRLLEGMEVSGPPPDAVAVRNAIFSCCSAKEGPRMGEAIQLLGRVKAGSFPDVPADAISYNLLVRACDDAGLVSFEALRLLLNAAKLHLAGGDTELPGVIPGFAPDPAAVGRGRPKDPAANGGAQAVGHQGGGGEWAGGAAPGVGGPAGCVGAGVPACAPMPPAVKTSLWGDEDGGVGAPAADMWLGEEDKTDLGASPAAEEVQDDGAEARAGAGGGSGVEAPTECAGGARASPEVEVGAGEAAARQEGPADLIVRHLPWLHAARVPAWEEESAFPPPDPEAYRAALSVVYHEKSWQRRPRTVNDLNVWAVPPNTIRFAPADVVGRGYRRTDVPLVDGAFVISGVLTGRECEQIMALGECIGYAPDEPLSRHLGVPGDPDDIPPSERVAGCEWLVDPAVHDALFERVRASLPAELEGGKYRLAGINPRWRLFKYCPGEVYRPHVDGSWPLTGLRDGKYVYDLDGAHRTRFTFLLYLNEGFEGGETTFYTAGAGEKATLEARGVTPRMGSVLCFPHGDAVGSLVHEGSEVRRGAKYVVRSDVLYTLPPEECKRRA